MDENTKDFFKEIEINIIEWKNVVAIVAILVLLATIFFNLEDIKSLKGKGRSLDDGQTRALDIGITIMMLVIVLSSVYLAQKSYDVEKAQGLEASNLKVIALLIAIIPAGLFVYSAITSDSDQVTGLDTFL